MCMKNICSACVAIVMLFLVSSCSYLTAMGRLEKAVLSNDVESIKNNLPSAGESLSAYSAEDLIVLSGAYARLYDASGNEEYGLKAIEALNMARDKDIVKAFEKLSEFTEPQRIGEPQTMYNQLSL